MPRSLRYGPQKARASGRDDGFGAIVKLRDGRKILGGRDYGVKAVAGLPHSKKEGRSAILSLSSAAAPLGTRFIVERTYRGGISDVDPLPARLNLRAQDGALRSLWLNPALCGSPVYRRGAKSVA